MAYGSERSAINAGQLIHKEMTGQLTEAERMELSRWLDTHPQNRQRYEQIKSSGWHKTGMDELKRYDSAASLDKLLLRLKPKPAVPMKVILTGIAAMLLVSLSIGLGFYLRNQQTAPSPSLSSKYGGDVLPGSNRATLTLADGSTIDLDSVANGILARQQGINISKSEEGITYGTQSRAARGAASPVGFHTVSTPRGGQYRIILPDGTTVWLNAASSLHYPTAFNAQERKVELNGEAYFEVAQDQAHPFIVTAGGQTVEVLGTHFNISSYTNDAAIKTTLLEGSVKVVGAGTTKILKPGQQSSITADQLIVESIDTELAVAWKNNQFMFESESIENIMKMVERWYDVNVEYVGNIPEDRFVGTVSRFDNVSNVLRILELTGRVRFKVEGHKIYVSK